MELLARPVLDYGYIYMTFRIGFSVVDNRCTLEISTISTFTYSSQSSKNACRHHRKFRKVGATAVRLIESRLCVYYVVFVLYAIIIVLVIINQALCSFNSCFFHLIKYKKEKNMGQIFNHMAFSYIWRDQTTGYVPIYLVIRIR